MSLQPKHESHDCPVCGASWVCSSMDCDEAQEAPCYADTQGFGPTGYHYCLSTWEGRKADPMHGAPAGAERSYEYP